MSVLGYALWYWVLPQLEVTVGALAQLLVPVFALLLGALFLQEVESLTTILSATLPVVVSQWAVYDKGKPSFLSYDPTA